MLIASIATRAFQVGRRQTAIDFSSCVLRRSGFNTMFDTEKLVIEIQNRVCLWNLGDKSYSDRVAKQRAWEEIGKCFHDDWDSYTIAEKQEKGMYFNLFIIVNTHIVMIAYYEYCNHMILPRQSPDFARK